MGLNKLTKIVCEQYECDRQVDIAIQADLITELLETGDEEIPTKVRREEGDICVKQSMDEVLRLIKEAR